MESLTKTLAILVAVITVAGCSTTGDGERSLLTMVALEGGEFRMGSANGRDNEQPVHAVRVDPFLMSVHEVTQGQWREVMGTTPTADRGKGENYPVYNITWYDAIAFCNALSEAEGLAPAYSGAGTAIECDFSADGYRLPTEAEWEYAARGGQVSGGSEYAGSNDPAQVGWYAASSGGAGHEVGLKAPNELGLFDMSGNVAEWCWDRYSSRYYEESPGSNPTGPESGMYRVLRGGSWGINEDGLRVASRGVGTHRSDSNTGFRCVRSVR